MIFCVSFKKKKKNNVYWLHFRIKIIFQTQILWTIWKIVSINYKGIYEENLMKQTNALQTVSMMLFGQVQHQST